LGLKGNTKNTFIAVDMYLEEIVDNIIEILESMDNNVFEKGISKNQLKEVIKLNLLKQY
jgi:flagellar basal body-associated protein FliL